MSRPNLQLRGPSIFPVLKERCAENGRGKGRSYGCPFAVKPVPNSGNRHAVRVQVSYLRIKEGHILQLLIAKPQSGKDLQLEHLDDAELEILQLLAFQGVKDDHCEAIWRRGPAIHIMGKVRQRVQEDKHPVVPVHVCDHKHVLPAVELLVFRGGKVDGKSGSPRDGGRAADFLHELGKHPAGEEAERPRVVNGQFQEPIRNMTAGESGFVAVRCKWLAHKARASTTGPVSQRVGDSMTAMQSCSISIGDSKRSEWMNPLL